ncbi:MAG: hypothetical protein ABIG56_02595 [Candidatus Omnitrophota bacterium]
MSILKILPDIYPVRNFVKIREFLMAGICIKDIIVEGGIYGNF